MGINENSNLSKCMKVYNSKNKLDTQTYLDIAESLVGENVDDELLNNYGIYFSGFCKLVDDIIDQFTKYTEDYLSWYLNSANTGQKSNFEILFKNY